MYLVFFFNDTATTEIYTLSLHDALPILSGRETRNAAVRNPRRTTMKVQPYLFFDGRCEEAIDFYKKALGAEVVYMMRFNESPDRSEEHTSELQSRQYLVCRLLLEKKKNI